jgi:putative Mg2+ transporter-C (MgtC) family protein
MDINIEFIERIGAAFIAGALLGFEREYRSKPAGLRTIILITVGSCVFSMLNITLNSQSVDRIASQVVTGVGFVGAGVIFKEGINVKGLTTAATIWVAAAIGMALGFGEYIIAAATLLLVLVTLIILSRIESWLTERELKEYRFTFMQHDYSCEELEKFFKSIDVKCSRTDFSKGNEKISVEYKFHIDEKRYQLLVNHVLDNKHIIQFERTK